MEHINIAIVTNDRAYGETLGRALLSVCRTMIINLFTAQEFIPEGDAPNHGFDLVLWDGLQPSGGENQILLVEKPSLACPDAASGRYRLYKFSPAQKMVSDLFFIYSRITGRRPTNVSGQNVHLYAFCSSAGGTGCSTVAMAVSQELERFREEQVLYLSLEELESTGAFMKTPTGLRTMSQYLYDLFKTREETPAAAGRPLSEFSPFMESYAMRDDFGVESFCESRGRNPLVALTREEICAFTESVMRGGRYSTVIVDTGNGLSPAAVTCLEMAERICLVSKASGNVAREDHFLQYLIASAGEDMIRKMIKIENMASHERAPHGEPSDDAGEPMIPTEMTIEMDTVYAEEGPIKKVLLEGNFGNNINQLTNKIIEPME